MMQIQATRMLFICGLHRSGTSLLEQYLFANFSVSALRSPVPENEGQFLQDVYKPAKNYGGPGKFAFDQTMQNDLEELSDYSSYATRMLKSWSRHTVGQGSFLLEKSPPNITKIWWLRRVFPDAIIIVWTRDPRAVSGAKLKWSNTSLEELMQHWDAAYTLAVKDIDDETITMRYEDFCESPDECIQQSGIADFLQRRSNPLPLPNRFSSITDSNSEYIKLFENKTILGGIWEKFGYDTSN
jgi:hypothetical protein